MNQLADEALNEHPDRSFRFLTRAQGARLRELATAATARYGDETTAQSDHLRGAAGWIYTLHSLAIRCNEARDVEAWPEIVDEYFRIAVGAMKEPDRFKTMDPADVLARSYLQVLPTDFAPGIAERQCVRRLAMDLLEVPVLDQPDTIDDIADDKAEEIGLEALRVAGRTNLSALPIEIYERIDKPSGDVVHLVAGESFFTASKVLMLPDLVRRTAKEEIPPYGALVVVPHRQMVAFHLIRDESYFSAANALLDLAVAQYETAAGPISPAVYWWRAGRLIQALRLEDRSLDMEQELIELWEYLKYDG